MLFSSIPFLYYFLPGVLALYFVAPKAWKNLVLLLSSLFFYAWGEQAFLIVMLIAIVSGYAFGILIEKFQKTKLAAFFLGLSVTISVGMLVGFKLSTVFPIGISFYTFQILSYNVDVYRGTVKPQKNFISLATYISMFPQLIAGPIVRYADVENQIDNRTHSFEKIALGLRRFILGLGKKILIANALGELVEHYKASQDLSVGFFWLYAVTYTLHIYFDFSGYSDMAIGLAKIFGFELMENFNYPYISKSITEFWRRWHISLGQWFRDYVYIPLGGNRVSMLKWLRNILIVWALTGFWHGAAGNFIVWGLYFACFLVLEKFLLRKKLEQSRIFSHIYVMLFVIISFVIFDATSLAEALKNIGGMFGFAGVPLISQECMYYAKSYGILLIIAIIGTTPFPKKMLEKLRENIIAESILNICEPIVLVGLLLVMTGYLVDGSFNPFLYFRF